MNCVWNAVIIGIVLNLLLPLILDPIATNDEKKQPKGSNNLSLKGQFMHMMMNHGQVPMLSLLLLFFCMYL
jgi:hypothetical protein